jgi:hypothetical protein
MIRAVMLLLALSACHKPAPGEVRQIAAEATFWQWFRTHADKVATIRSAKEPIADELATELHKVDPGLTFEVGFGGKRPILIISADGVLKTFPAVKRLVDAAPRPLGNWLIVAFRPRKPEISSIELGNGRKVSMDGLRVVTAPRHDGKLDVVVYVSGGPVDDSCKQAVFLLLDSALGEYDVEMRLGAIEMSDKPAPASARPFTDLAAIVDGKS